MRNILYGIFLMAFSFCLYGEPTVVPDPRPCLKDLQTHFFREDILYEALSLYHIPQGIWSPIYQELQLKSREVPDRMKKRTAYMVPNPLEYPINREFTARLLKVVLFEIFMETMNDNRTNEQPTSTYIFDFVFSKRMPDLKACLGEEVEKLAPKFE